MPKKQYITIIALAAILILGGISYGSYYFWQKSAEKASQKTSPNPSTSVSTSSNPLATADETANWQTYKNKE
ncbi:MAG: hypothetical protein Q7R92_02400 [bacterium]|nr:hypothetical protein [bacterium]